MATSQPEKLKSLELLITDICGCAPRLAELIPEFRQRIELAEKAQDPRLEQKSATYGRLVAFVDSLVRLRLFLEHNFNYVETIGVLAVARYLFELTVWLKLLQMASRYGLVYYHELLKNQADFYIELRNNAVREISFLRHIGAREQSLIQSRLSEAMGIPNEEARKQALRRLSNDITQEIDRAASRTFSLYAEQAQTNGYDFQAYLVETKVLPDITKAIADLTQKLSTIEMLARRVCDFLPKRWVWKDQAARVDMKDEYDFIYAYASRLLHATPASLTTNQKNLEPDEMRAFLKYIRVRLLDVIEMAEGLLATDSTVIH